MEYASNRMLTTFKYALKQAIWQEHGVKQDYSLAAKGQQQAEAAG